MSSLYEINEELLKIFAEIEDNNGEITEEQEKQLAISEKERIIKLENYAKVINSYKSDIKCIQEEKKRLDRRKEILENRIKKLEEIMIKAIELFGPIETGLYRIGTRKSKSINVDNIRINKLNHAIFDFAREIHSNGVIAFGENCDVQGMLDVINANLKAEADNDEFIPYTIDDLACANININTNSNILSLFTEKDRMLESILNNEMYFNIDNNTSKTTLKEDLTKYNNITIGNIEEKENLSIR